MESPFSFLNPKVPYSKKMPKTSRELLHFQLLWFCLWSKLLWVVEKIIH